MSTSLDSTATARVRTGVESESRGLTVFLFLMSGSFSRPPLASMVAASLSRLTQRLFVLKNLCLFAGRQGSQKQVQTPWLHRSTNQCGESEGAAPSTQRFSQS